MEPNNKQSILFGRPTNHLKIGIVGMPNIGKSSLFNCLSGLSVPSENYPFCTIEPSTARVILEDKRFDHLVEHYKPKKSIPAILTVTDIAGLVKGASEGKGLGNEFLSHVNQVDGIFHLVRAFKDKSVEHVEGEIEPIRDLEIITNELRTKDIDILEKNAKSSERVAASTKNKKIKDEYNCLLKIIDLLKNKHNICYHNWSGNDINYINSLYLLSTKPIVYLVNVSKNNWKTGSNKWLLPIKKWVSNYSKDSVVIPICTIFESELMENYKDISLRNEYLKKNKLKSYISKVIKSGYSTLSLIHFFTSGKDEVKCWTIRKNTKAKKAAGVIHSDFEKGFICAEIMSYNDFLKYGNEQEVKNHGKYRTEGKDYIVKNGDIIYFKFNVGKSKKK